MMISWSSSLSQAKPTIQRMLRFVSISAGVLPPFARYLFTCSLKSAFPSMFQTVDVFIRCILLSYRHTSIE